MLVNLTDLLPYSEMEKGIPYRCSISYDALSGYTVQVTEDLKWYERLMRCLMGVFKHARHGNS